MGWSARLREDGVLQAVSQYLALRRDVTAWRMNTGAIAVPGSEGRKRRFVRYGTPGQADLTGLLKPWGVRLEIEVKAPGGRQSPAQKDFAARIRAAGGVYLLADSVESCRRQLDEAIAEIARREGQR